MFRGTSLKSDFWDGRAIDKQINDPITTISDYWIRDFLKAEFKATPAAATKRLAVALRNSTRKAADVTTKQELAAAARLAKNLDGKPTSAERFTKKFQLSAESIALLKDELKTDRAFKETFTFSKQEFLSQLTFQSIDLDNGGILTADASEFDQIFEQQRVRGAPDKTRYSTVGREVDRKLKSTK